MNTYPRKIVSKCVSDPLDETHAQRNCPKCDGTLIRIHFPGDFSLPECWWSVCESCDYKTEPE